MARGRSRCYPVGMASTNAPTPFDPPDLPVAFSALNWASRSALRVLWDGGQASYLTQLQALSAVDQVGALWHLTTRGYQLAAYGLAKDMV